MKSLAFIPLILLVLSGVWFAVCKAAGLPYHSREIVLACIVCFLAAQFALLPAVLLRKADSGTLSQAGLVGTVVHMFLTLILASIVWMSHWIENRKFFLFALVGYFWITLLALVIILARLIRESGQKKSGEMR